MPNHSHSRMCTTRVTDLDPNTRLVKEVMMVSVVCHNHNRILTSRMKKHRDQCTRLEKLVIMSFYVVRCPQTLQAQLDVYMKVTPPKS